MFESGPRKRREYRVAFFVPEIIGVYGHGLCPAESEQNHTERTHRIKMLYGVEGESAHISRRVVAEKV